MTCSWQARLGWLQELSFTFSIKTLLFHWASYLHRQPLSFFWGTRILSVAPNSHQLNRNQTKTTTIKTKFFLSFQSFLTEVLESNLLGFDCAFLGSTLAPGPSGPYALRGAMILWSILGCNHQKKGQWLMSGKSNKTMQVRWLKKGQAAYSSRCYKGLPLD